MCERVEGFKKVDNIQCVMVEGFKEVENTQCVRVEAEWSNTSNFRINFELIQV